jgi:hypothetical protein
VSNETKKDTILNEFVKRTGRAPTPAEEDLLNMMGTQVSATDYLDKVAKAAMSEVEVKPQEKELSELEKKKLEDYEAAGKKFEQEEKDRKIKQEKDNKERELKEKGAKDIKEWAAGFYGETLEHLAWRNRLFAITKEYDHASSKRKVELDIERETLRGNYKKKHYEIGTKSFNKVLLYESVDRELRLESKDNGHTWALSELLSSGQWARGQFKLIMENGKPTRLTTVIENETLYDFMKKGIEADFTINLKDEPDKIEIHNSKPSELTLLPEHEHKWFEGKCCLCGEPKEKGKE